MDDNLFSNKEVSRVTGLSPRQVLSWTEKGLVKPKKPAKKAGTRRGYDYVNLLEWRQELRPGPKTWVKMRPSSQKDALSPTHMF
ncbi:MAG: MerR family transcriptional regulator [Deltaproteobacteria bacterium]|nr:MerR family transcriptional regulator [Deltaproteobacteria bacterium]